MKYNLIGLFILAIAFASCDAEKSFTVKGKIEGYGDGRLIAFNQNDPTKMDTINISMGEFELKGKIDEPTPFQFWEVNIFPPNFTIFLEPGETKITGMAGQQNALKIEAGQTHKDYEKYIEITGPIINSFDSLSQLVSTGEAKNISDQDVQTYAAELEKNYIAEQIQYIQANPKSYASALVAYEYLRGKSLSMSHQEKLDFVSELDPIIQKSSYGILMNEMIEAQKKTAIGMELPDFKLPDPSSSAISLQSYRGQYVLVDFWASWCGPCRQENPTVVKAFEKYKDRGFTVVGVSLDSDKKQWLAAIKADKLNWPQASDLKQWDSEVVGLYDLKSIPANFLIDPNGIIIAKDLRGAALDQTLEKVLSK